VRFPPNQLIFLLHECHCSAPAGPILSALGHKFGTFVAEVSNLLIAGLPSLRTPTFSTAEPMPRLPMEIGDTAGWKPALRHRT